jgi:lysophospholipase L1-like esterase
MSTVVLKRNSSGVSFTKDGVRVVFDNDKSYTISSSGSRVVFVVDGTSYGFSNQDNVTINDQLFSGTGADLEDKLRDEVFIGLIIYTLPTDNILAMYDMTDPANLVKDGSNNITTFLDSGPNGYHIQYYAGGKSVWSANGGPNNLPFVTTQTGAGYAIVGTIAIPQPFTLYYVCNIPEFQDSKRFFRLDSGNTVFFGTQYGGIHFHAGQGFAPGLRRDKDLMRLNRWQVLGETYANAQGDGYAKLQINDEPDASKALGETGPGIGTIDRIGFTDDYNTLGHKVSMIIIYTGLPTPEVEKARLNFLMQRFNPPKNKQLVVFGDSVSTGAAATDIVNEGYVMLVGVEKDMNTYNYAVPGSVAVATAFHPGVAGKTFVDLADVPFGISFDAANMTIILAYGTNDQTADAGWKATYKSTIQSKLIARGIPLSKIIICTSSVVGRVGNPLMREIATELGITLFDAEAYIAANGGSANFDPDGIHLNTTGHRKFADGLKLVMT